MYSYESINRKSRVLRQRIMQEQDPFKRKVLLCYISKTKTVEQITQDYGISMGRLYRWIHTFADTNTEDSPSRPDATRPDATAAEAAVANPTFITKILMQWSNTRH